LKATETETDRKKQSLTLGTPDRERQIGGWLRERDMESVTVR
jgi:hypothetical protein